MLEKVSFNQKTMGNYQTNFEVRDLREKDRFIVDDKFLNGYARFLGIYAVGVYNSLCRHANRDQRCWPSINRMAKELAISRNKVIDSIKYLEFWQIVKKERLAKKLTNRYLLLSKRYWKPRNKETLKEFSEVYHINFTSLLDKLNELTSSTSIVRKHKSKLFKNKGNVRPYFWGKPMWKDKNGKWWVIHGQNDFREFAGKEADIEWE